MIALKIENPKVEEIFIKRQHHFLISLDKSCKQAILQQNGKLEETTLQDLIKILK